MCLVGVQPVRWQYQQCHSDSSNGCAATATIYIRRGSQSSPGCSGSSKVGCKITDSGPNDLFCSPLASGKRLLHYRIFGVASLSEVISGTEMGQHHRSRQILKVLEECCCLFDGQHYCEKGGEHTATPFHLLVFVDSPQNTLTAFMRLGLDRQHCISLPSTQAIK